MPIYEYECRHCGELAQRKGSMQDPPPETYEDSSWPCGTTKHIQSDTGKSYFTWQPRAGAHEFRRRYAMPRTNLGYSEARHTPNEQFMFKHL